jgi:hypothetical protein
MFGQCHWRKNTCMIFFRGFAFVCKKRPWTLDWPPQNLGFNFGSQSYPTFGAFLAFSVYVQLGSVHYDNTFNFVLRILSICTVSFRKFRKFAQGLSGQRFPLFHILGKSVKIYSAHYQYKLNFIFSVYSKICTDSFHVLGKCAQRNSN